MAVDEDTATSVLDKLDHYIGKVEQIVPLVSSDNTKKLSDYFIRLAPHKSALHTDQRLQIWKLSFRLWNSCVDISNAAHNDTECTEEQAKLRHLASELLLVAGKVEGIPSPLLKTATFFHKTGIVYHKICKYDLAVSCYEKATELISCERDEIDDEDYAKFCFDLLLSRAKTAWQTSQRTLTCTYLGRAKGLLLDVSERYRDLAEIYLSSGRSILTHPEPGLDAVMLLNQAFEICCEALSKRVADRSLIEDMKVKTLRYLAAAHLQGEDFHNVLKCVGVLKVECDHPTTSFLALKAYIGLGLRDEAENVLRQLLEHKRSPLDICLSAVESFIQSGLGSLDTAKTAFFCLLNRFPAKKDLPVKVLEKILVNLSSADPSYKAKVSLALQIACDESIIKLFSASSDDSGNERRCLHALLWNSGSELFRAKLYDMSIALFEGSMLYIPLDAEHSFRRAKSLRVLCLCHLALLQYDRADEYITEAEKVEPNVICAFLKYKVRLQMKDEAEATEIISKMVHCADFDPDYLTLATHEAVVCKSVGVASAALSKLLALCSAGKQISTKEIVIIRNIIQLQIENSDDQNEILHYMKYAKERLSKEGKDYFGAGIVAEKELSWFAASSWNCGINVAKRNDYNLCSEFLSCAGAFYSAMDESVDSLRMLLKSRILSVAAFLSTRTRNHDIGIISELLEQLENANKVQEILASKEEKVDESWKVYILMLSFELRGLTKDHKVQLQVIHKTTGIQNCKVEYLLRMGIHACGYGHTNLEVATAALKACLNKVMSGTNPDYGVASNAIRKLIWVCDAQGDEEAAADVYRQAYQIILGTKTSKYPDVEVKWLFSTAWNRSGVHVRFNRVDKAKVWMKMAIDFVKLIPSMTSLYASSMIQSLAQFEDSQTSCFPLS